MSYPEPNWQSMFKTPGLPERRPAEPQRGYATTACASAWDGSLGGATISPVLRVSWRCRGCAAPWYRRVRRFRPTDCRQLTREAGEETNPWLLHSTTSCRLTRFLHPAMPIRTCRDAPPVAWPSSLVWTRA